MQEELKECIRAISECTSRDEETFCNALGNIHRIVFGVSIESEIEVTFSQLLSSCEKVVNCVGGSLGRRKLSPLIRLPMEVVVVELMARLTRVLFWGLEPSNDAWSHREPQNQIKIDAEQLEVLLLPRFFLKLPTSPAMLRDVLLKAPWSLFFQRYGSHNSLEGKMNYIVPSEVVAVLTGFRTNFGCDFLLNICVDVGPCLSLSPTNEEASRTTANNLTTSAALHDESAGSCSGAAKPGCPVGTDAVDVARNDSEGWPGHNILFNRGTLRETVKRGAPKAGTVDTSARASKKPLPTVPNRNLPAYMLTKRRLSATPSLSSQCADVARPIDHNERLLSTPDVHSSSDDDSDTEVLARESPVRKKVCVDGAVVPPSPIRSERVVEDLHPL
uniref:Uncharacterized protein n=1 Tax=Trypanosoma congolense (strain IL3000) TaxID=1068625 RepID=G0URF4_TRYCI|nr:conserved hypothetical protein [Trypanosoma congolense IL3000]